MNPQEIADQLRAISSSDDFAFESEKIVEDWISSSVGFECVESVLRFMEDYPAIDFGIPGALVHYLEKWHGKGYEEKLIESICRKPTPHTVWMLNRLINGEKSINLKRKYIEVMEKAKHNPLANSIALDQMRRFIERARRIWPDS